MPIIKKPLFALTLQYYFNNLYIILIIYKNTFMIRQDMSLFSRFMRVITIVDL